MHRFAFIVFALVSAALTPSEAAAQTAQWIWGPASPAVADQVVYFRKTSFLWNSRLTVAADDSAEVFLNGLLIARCESWERPLRTEVTVRLNQGENVIALRAINRSGPGAVLVHLNLLGKTNVVSDT